MSELAVVLNADLVSAWSTLTADHNPLHVDDQFARSTSFGRTIVQGHLIATLGVDALVDGGFAVGLVTFTFREPIPVGTEVTITATAASLSVVASGRQPVDVLVEPA